MRRDLMMSLGGFEEQFTGPSCLRTRPFLRNSTLLPPLFLWEYLAQLPPARGFVLLPPHRGAARKKRCAASFFSGWRTTSPSSRGWISGCTRRSAGYYGATAIRISTVYGVFQIPSLLAFAGAWIPDVTGRYSVNALFRLMTQLSSQERHPDR